MTKTTDPFLRRANEKIESLKREIGLLEAQEAGVRRRRIELETAATEWGRSAELYTEAMGVDDAAATAPQDDRSKRTVAELITDYLDEQPAHAAKVATIAAWLAKVGKFPSGQDRAGQNYSMAYNALLRNKGRFEKAGTGEWRLISVGSADGANSANKTS